MAGHGKTLSRLAAKSLSKTLRYHEGTRRKRYSRFGGTVLENINSTRPLIATRQLLERRRITLCLFLLPRCRSYLPTSAFHSALNLTRTPSCTEPLADGWRWCLEVAAHQGTALSAASKRAAHQPPRVTALRPVLSQNGYSINTRRITCNQQEEITKHI